MLRSGTNNIEVPYSYFRNKKEQSVNISRTIVYKAMDSRQALLSADAATDSRFSLTDSIAQVNIRSFMCVPLIDSDGDVLGVVQIDTLDAYRRFTEKDLEILAALAPLIGKAIQTSQLHEEALAKRALERDLDLAQQVQIALLPQERPDLTVGRSSTTTVPPTPLAATTTTTSCCRRNRLGVIVADVSGHGIAAALLMTKLSAEAKFCLAGNEDPAKVMARLNQQLCEDHVEDRFVTMALLVVEPDNGHRPPGQRRPPAPVLRGTDGKTKDVGDYATGLPLGVMDNFDYEEATFEVHPGEAVTLVTDGITEATSPEGDMFGLERMRCQLSTVCREPARVWLVDRAGRAAVHQIRGSRGRHLRGLLAAGMNCPTIDRAIIVPIS